MFSIWSSLKCSLVKSYEKVDFKGPWLDDFLLGKMHQEDPLSPMLPDHRSFVYLFVFKVSKSTIFVIL